MARRPSLDQATVAARTASQAPATPPMPDTATPGTRRRAASREGKRGVAFWLTPEAFRQLELVAFEDRRTVQSLMEEATDMLFANRGKHRLARGDEGSSS